MNSAYSVYIPAPINGNPNLSLRQKYLYGRIMALANKEGYCFATNNFFAEEFKVHKDTISRDVSVLEKQGLIVKEIFRNNHNKITSRKLTPLLIPASIPIDASVKGSIKKEKIRKNTKKETDNQTDQPKTLKKLSFEPLFAKSFPNFLTMKKSELPKNKKDCEKLFVYWSKKEAIGDAKTSLTPCTIDELLYLAKKNRLYYEDVLKKYWEIIELINDGTFQKKYKYHKTLYFTLSKWLNMGIEKGYIERIVDEAEYQGHFNSTDGYLLPYQYKWRLMYYQLKQRKENNAK